MTANGQQRDSAIPNPDVSREEADKENAGEVKWFKKLRISHKIALGICAIVVLSLVTLLVVYQALKVSKSALDDVINREEPASAAAYEMEINVVESGLKVMKYLQTGDPAHRVEAKKDKNDFDRYLTRYNSLANDAREVVLGQQVGAVHEEYWRLGQQLMDWREVQEDRLALGEAGAEQIDQKLHVLLQRPSRINVKRLTLLQLETSLGEMGQALGAYLKLASEKTKNKIEEKGVQFEAQLRDYRRLALDATERAGAEQISRQFDEMQQNMRRILAVHADMTRGLDRFFVLRGRFDDLLDEGIQKLAAGDMEIAKREAKAAADAALRKTSLLIPLIILLSAGVGYLLVISGTRPVRQLVAGAAAIGAGDLRYRLPLLAADELGDLASQFNLMAQRLEESEARYQRVVAGTNDGIFDWNLQTNRIFFSQRFKSMLGYAEDEIGDDAERGLLFIHADDRERFRQNMAAQIATPGQSFNYEYRALHKDGSYRWMQYRALVTVDESGEPIHLAGSQTDIHARKITEEQLVHDALHDTLTGLPNRNLLLDRLQRAIERVKRHGNEICGLLFLDLDGFKLVNDSLGHLVGDQVLIALGQRLSNALRGTDTLGRFGGDEFAILVEDVKSEQEVIVIAERIQQDLQRPFNAGNDELYIGVSIGIALSTLHYERAEDMLRDADIAMYRAKAAGKGRHTVFDVSMRGSVVKRLELETQLRLAVERQELVIHYQPIVSLQDSGKLVGFEALLRWNHPELGLVPPNDFIPLLEESGLIVPVGEWLLVTACTVLKSWHREGYTPTLAVNISAIQLRERGLISAVTKALVASGLEPHYLTLEITESGVMQNEELAIGLLEEAKLLNVKLSVDDFGTGFSSLSYLKRFPWDIIKIDRSFVRDIATDPGDAAIIEAIIVMAHTLKFIVVAEGVETDEQLRFLINHDVNAAQGYFLARPAAEENWATSTDVRSRNFLRAARNADMNSANNLP